MKSIFENKNDGYYIDIGAHHPFRYSNTYLLYRQGWSGINIDARPDIINYFNKKRKRDINLSLGISDEKEELTYYMFNDPGINTFLAEAKDKQLKNKSFYLVDEIKINVTTLEEVFEKYLPKNQSIDLMNIDCEGFDLKVLKSFDLSQYAPKIIIIEDHNFILDKLNTGESNGEIFEYLNSFGYGLQYVIGSSLFFRLAEKN